AWSDARNHRPDLRVFPLSDASAGDSGGAKEDGAFGRAEGATVDRDRISRPTNHRPDMRYRRRRDWRGELPDGDRTGTEGKCRYRAAGGDRDVVAVEQSVELVSVASHGQCGDQPADGGRVGQVAVDRHE